MRKKAYRLKISNRVHVLRAEKRITQAQLAEAIDVTRATINALEKGNYNPSLELAFKLALYFGVDIHSMFTVGRSFDRVTPPKNQLVPTASEPSLLS